MSRPKDFLGFEYTPETGMRDFWILIVMSLAFTAIGRIPEAGAMFIFFVLGAVAAGDFYIDRRPVVQVLRYGLRLTAAYAAVPLLWLLGGLPSCYIIDAATLGWGWFRLATTALACMAIYIATAFGISAALAFNGTPRGHEPQSGDN